MSNARIDFLYAALTDCQGTIRAIDVKLGIMLTFLILPLTHLEKILARVRIVYHLAYLSHRIVLIGFFLLLFVFCLSWILSIIIALGGLCSLSNPIKYIANDVNANGAFFLGNICKPKLIHLFANRALPTRGPLSTIIAELPLTEDQIIQELVFEQMKASLIRNCKIFRQRFSLKLMMLWILSGGAIWITALLTR
jgi:hypothetical protein